MQERWDVVVVGAGLAGLTAAATAAGNGAATLVLEAHDPGGRATTDERGAYRFNRGGHALYQGGPAEAVLARLGVVVDGVAPPTGGARGRLGDRFDVLPGGLGSLVRTGLLSVRGKVALARMLAGVSRWRPEEAAGQTIGDWLDGFGLPPDARAVAGMLVRLTTFVNDEETVSADVAANQLRQADEHGVLYLHRGWSSLVDGLAAAARSRGAELRTGSAARSITARGDRWIVSGAGVDVEAGAVVVAAGPPGAAGALLPDVPAAWRGLAGPVEASSLELGLRRTLRHPILLGVDRPLYLIDHASTAPGLAPEGGGLVHVMRYLRLGEDASAAELRADLEEHARLAGIEAADVVEQRFLRRMTVAGAAPTPAAGGLAGRPRVDSAGLEGITVAGDWVGPDGWLTDAVLASGEAAGRSAARRAADLAPGRPARQDVA